MDLGFSTHAFRSGARLVVIYPATVFLTVGHDEECGTATNFGVSLMEEGRAGQLIMHGCVSRSTASSACTLCHFNRMFSRCYALRPMFISDDVQLVAVTRYGLLPDVRVIYAAPTFYSPKHQSNENETHHPGQVKVGRNGIESLHLPAAPYVGHRKV